MSIFPIQSFRFLLLFSALLLPLLSSAADADAKIVNAYFANDAIEVDGWLQPVRVIKEMQGNHPAAPAVFVLNVLLAPGEHKIAALIHGPDGKQFTMMNFAVEKVVGKQEVRAIWGVLKDRMPTGGITVKVVHQKNNGKASELGQFYLPTVP